MNSTNKVTGPEIAAGRSPWLNKLAEVNRELWLLLSLFIIAGLLNWLVASRGRILGFYTLPTLVSAYVYGRRHAVLTAMASVLLVVVVVYWSPALFVRSSVTIVGVALSLDLCVWACFLMV